MINDNATIWSALAILLSILVIPGSLLLIILTCAGIYTPSPRRNELATGRFAIVVPAHNEGMGILRTLRNLQNEVARDGDAEIIVIADNCHDNTAAIVAEHGIRVLQREDQQRRGKGFALDFAFQHLLKENFRYFLVIDADSEVDSGFLSALRGHFGNGTMAVQSRYLVLNPDSSPRTRLMELALSAFNVLRPRGRANLGWSAGLFGNGFALRREVLENIPYTAGSIVEDLEYHLVLIWHDIRVKFADDTTVRAEMPAGKLAARTQRTRWEGGRLRMLVQHAPGLFVDLLCGRSNAFEPLLDLLLLPISYHVLLLILMSFIPLQWPFFIAMSGLAIVAFHTLAAARVGRLSHKYLFTLLYVPFYLVWKIALIPATIISSGRNAPWMRTAREAAHQAASGDQK